MAAPFPETTMRRLFASFFFSFLFLSVAAAADSPPVHLKGAIQSVNGQTFTMSGSSAPVAVKLTDQTRIASLETAQLADITQGMFVGTAALPQADGTLKALEVHIFPEAMRGTGEGYRPFPQVQGGSMTNATITDIVGTQGAVTDDGLKLTLKYKDGEKTVVVPKGTPVVLLGKGDASMLKQGAKVSVTGTKEAGGVTATRILVGLDGATPPI
jgi:RNase P/RNase MRP subunit p29